MSPVSQAKLQRWAEIADAVTRCSAARVACPECDSGSIRVRDVEYGEGQAKGVARYLYCSHCGALNVSNLRRAGVSSR